MGSERRLHSAVRLNQVYARQARWMLPHRPEVSLALTEGSTTLD